MLGAVGAGRVRSAAVFPVLAVLSLWVMALSAYGEGPPVGVLQRSVCGSLALRSFQAVAKPLAPLQEVRAPIQVGEQHQFVHAFSPTVPVAATCRWVGEHAYIFVQDSRWDENGGLVDQGHVDTLGRLFEEQTPADASRGIYDTNTAAFGAPADVDGDGRVAIVVLDINEPAIVGFFDSGVATHPSPEFRWDAVFLDEFSVRRDSYLARGTLAHEFQHLIHWAHDQDEITWIEEGLSGYAEALNGYPEADPRAVPAFLEEPGIGLLFPLFSSNTARYYGSTYLFTAFMAEKYGGAYIRDLVAEQRNGAAGIDATLARGGWGETFVDVWGKWNIANYASADPTFSYAALQGRQAFTFELAGATPLVSGAQVIEQWGTVNVLLRVDGDLALDFVGQSTGRFRVWLYGWRRGQGELREISLADGVSGRGEISGVDSLALIVGRTGSLGGNFDFTVSRFVPTSVVETGIPRRLSLPPVYPNPFNSAVQVPFELARADEVFLEIFDILGRRVRLLQAGRLPQGAHLRVWDGRDDEGRVVGSGVYQVQLRAEGQRFRQMLTLIK
jgi:hypothetical protein